MESGHYYAYIRPELDDRWFEFNDARVTEVSKHRAFGEGIGGNDRNFCLVRDTDSTKLTEESIANETNAYMLIYVRRSQLA